MAHDDADRGIRKLPNAHAFGIRSGTCKVGGDAAEEAHHEGTEKNDEGHNEYQRHAAPVSQSPRGGLIWLAGRLVFNGGIHGDWLSG